MSWQRQPPRFGVLNPELIASVCFPVVSLNTCQGFRVPPIERSRRGCARRRRSATASSASVPPMQEQPSPSRLRRSPRLEGAQELAAFSLHHPSPCPVSVRVLPPPSAHARIWQALAFSLSASAMVARVVALLALALLAVTDAVPRRVKQVRHGKLQPSRLLTYLLTVLNTALPKIAV